MAYDILYGTWQQAGPASVPVIPGERGPLHLITTGSLSFSLSVPGFKDAAHGHIATNARLHHSRLRTFSWKLLTDRGYS